MRDTMIPEIREASWSQWGGLFPLPVIQMLRGLDANYGAAAIFNGTRSRMSSEAPPTSSS
jgi:hypothetical protein